MEENTPTPAPTPAPAPRDTTVSQQPSPDPNPTSVPSLPSTADDKQEPPQTPSSSSPTHNDNNSNDDPHDTESTTEEDIYLALAHALTADRETPHEHAAREALTYTRTGTSTCSAASRPPDYEVTFAPGDPEHPRNWPLAYRVWILFVLSYSTWLTVLYSTGYTASMPGLTEEFGVSTTVATLGLTTYLLGLAAGSLIVAPMSELYGRQNVYVFSMVVSTLLIIPCALATSLTEMIVVRFFGAFIASAFVSNSPGTIVDVTGEKYRALAMSLWSIAPLNGPVTGPIIGGFVFQHLGWRWNNWVVIILSGASILGLLTLRETYAPAILQKKAARRRKETDDLRWWCKYDERVSKWQLIKVNLSRPFVLSCTEPILWFFNLWISLVYGILYLCFLAYPIVFSQHRGWGPGTSGLAFCGIGIGTVITIVCEPLLRRIIHAQPRDPATGAILPEASATIMIIGSILTPLGQLGFSWTGLPTTIHWAVPIAFGIPFGMGNSMSFIYGSNYLATAYGMYSASALAGNTVMRSVVGGVLPLAGPSMYERLTPQWAGTLMGLLEVAMIPIPLVFWKYGARIRKRSRVMVQMREEEEKAEAKRRRYLARQEAREKRRAERGAAAVEAVDDEEEEEDDGESGVDQVSRPCSGAERDVEKAASSVNTADRRDKS